MSGAALTTLLLIYSMLWLPMSGYVMQKYSKCRFGDNKEGNITFDTGFTFNRQTVLLYSKEDEMYLPCPDGCIDQMEDVAKSFAVYFNTNPDTVTQVKKEEERCKGEVKTYWYKTVERRSKPSVEVFSPVQIHTENLPVLVCYVWGFYPQDINVAWLKNDILVRNYTEAVQIGDWTYQIVAVLDLGNSISKDNYTCLIHHPSLDMPIAKIWKHGLTNIQIIKISVASVVFALGLVWLITAIACWRNAKRSGYTPISGYDDDN